MWRVVKEGFGTLDEVYSTWSMIDLFDANIVISAFAHAEAEAQKLT